MAAAHILGFYPRSLGLETGLFGNAAMLLLAWMRRARCGGSYACVEQGLVEHAVWLASGRNATLQSSVVHPAAHMTRDRQSDARVCVLCTMSLYLKIE